VLEFFRKGWISEFWVSPMVRFTYLGFDWVKPVPEPWLSALMAVMGIAALALAAGFWYRVAAWSVFLIFTYQFLLEATRYLNHFYAACLFAFLLCFVPAANALSVDRALRPSGADGTVPLWSLWLLRFQVGILYVYGGFAKLQGDWIAGQPVESWMSRRAHIPFVSFLVDNGWEVAFFAWGGVLFDLLVVPALLWRRTRPFAVAAMLAFHLMNAYLLRIGVFPWMMIALTTIFLNPDWPRRLVRTVAAQNGRLPKTAGTTVPLSRTAFAAIAVWVILQCAWPARSHLYPGNVLWTEEAQSFSWRMMLREKRGETRMLVETERGIDTVSLSQLLRPWQVQPVATRPYLTLQLAHFLADYYRQNGYRDVRVFADSWMSLNGREPQRMIDPEVDLASQPRTFLPATWILPLETPRPARGVTSSGVRSPP
jgi:hypothetical protein